MAQSRVVSEIINVEKYCAGKSVSEVTQSQCKLYDCVDGVWFPNSVVQ